MKFSTRFQGLVDRAAEILSTPVFGGRLKGAQPPGSAPGAGVAAVSSSSALPSPRKAEAWLRTFNRNSRVRGPVNRIAVDVAAVPWRVCRRVGYRADGTPDLVEIRGEHPLKTLWAAPNPFQLGGRFRRLAVIYLEMAGRAPIWIERDPEDPRKDPDGVGMRPKYLWLIRPQDVLKKPTEKQPFWVFKLRGKKRTARPQDMLWLTQDDPEDPYGWGIGTASAVDHEVTQDESTAVWNANFFRQGAHLGKVVGVPGLGEQGAELRADFEKNHTGVENAHRVLFIGTEGAGGKMEVAELGANHKDLDFVEGRRFLRDTMAQNWTVPPELLGIVEDSNRATADAAKSIHQEINVAPHVGQLAEYFNQRLVPLYGEPDLVLVPDDPVQESREFRHTVTTDGLIRGAVMVDEWRQAHGMNPIGGALGRRFLVPMNIVPVSTEDDGDEGAAGAAATGGGAGGGGGGSAGGKAAIPDGWTQEEAIWLADQVASALLLLRGE